MKKNNYRIESDSLGKVKVPKHALYGAPYRACLGTLTLPKESDSIL